MIADRLKYIALAAASLLCLQNGAAQKFRHIPTQDQNSEAAADTVAERDIRAELDALPPLQMVGPRYSMMQVPLVFKGYQHMRSVDFTPEPLTWAVPDTLAADLMPQPGEWLDRMKRLREIDREAAYTYMLDHPTDIDYALWKLPEPVRLMESVFTKASFVKNQDIPEVDNSAAVIVETPVRKKHWLHLFDGSIQFSQAYLSPNWYQGGTNNLSLLIGLLWNVRLNEAYHPNKMLESNLQYKLGLYSTPTDQYHKYSISEDLFEWNFKAGLRAFNKWFYSTSIRFKTQLLNNYVANSLDKSAAFLSPADLNVGLGMTYTTQNAKETFKLSASISPISYNLRTCFAGGIDPTQFNIPAGHKTASEVGSTAEMTLTWKLTSNINYKSRLYLFSNYKNMLGDWENTLSFSINRFLSTQIYAHLRYDTSSDARLGHWRHWMFKEILSFGFQYKFSTVP